jgi:hypothetical protein
VEDGRDFCRVPPALHADVTQPQDVFTPTSFPSPADLETPPDLDAVRPLCRCGAAPAPPLVGMHGDGLIRRSVPWPVVGDAGTLAIQWVRAVGRRFWCPSCQTTASVHHPGLRHGAVFGAAVIAALLYVIALRPLGAGGDDAVAYELVYRRKLPASERARPGRPRWSSLRRWLRDLEKLWPSLVFPLVGRTARLGALLAAFGVGASLREVLGAAILAHARGGDAM